MLGKDLIKVLTNYLQKTRHNKVFPHNEDHLGGGTPEFALMRLEAQFLATWLNISAGFQNPEMVVYLDRIKGTPVDPVKLYGAKKLPLKEVIRITEEGIRGFKECGTGWGHDEFVTAHKIFTLVNEAEDNDGYPFRPWHASRLP